jgi:hypothetical protein
MLPRGFKFTSYEFRMPSSINWKSLTKSALSQHCMHQSVLAKHLRIPEVGIGFRATPGTLRLLWQRSTSPHPQVSLRETENLAGTICANKCMHLCITPIGKSSVLGNTKREIPRGTEHCIYACTVDTGFVEQGRLRQRYNAYGHADGIDWVDVQPQWTTGRQDDTVVNVPIGRDSSSFERQACWPYGG